MATAWLTTLDWIALALCGLCASAASWLYRYTGMQDAEGAFLACSFWLASALASLGRTDEATTQMDAAVGLAGDLGLFAEQVAPDRSMLGNAPQGLSQVALINAAFAIHQTGSRR